MSFSPYEAADATFMRCYFQEHWGKPAAQALNGHSSLRTWPDKASGRGFVSSTFCNIVSTRTFTHRHTKTLCSNVTAAY